LAETKDVVITQRLCDNNVRLMTASFFCVCVGYAGFQTLSVPLYAPSKVGATAVGTQVLVFTFCCLGPNTLIIEWLGTKNALSAAFAGELLYCIANVVAVHVGPGERQYFILLPFACLVGLSNAVMWTVQGLFITNNAAHAARLSGDSQEITTGRYFGLFNTFSDLTGLVAFIVQAASGLSTMYLFGVFGILAVVGLILSSWLTELPALPSEDDDNEKGGGSESTNTPADSADSKSTNTPADSKSTNTPADSKTNIPADSAVDSSADGEPSARGLLSHVQDAVAMWCNRRFMLMIPFFCYIGLSDGTA
jgi:hypothetical protein